jgi:glycosyltransferase involved in cell wall biosynthesis
MKVSMNKVRWYLKRMGEVAQQLISLVRSGRMREGARYLRAVMRGRRERALLRDYGRWFSLRLKARKRLVVAVGSGPKISVVVPVHRPLRHQLDRAVASVRGQTYQRWELILIDDGSGDARLSRRLEAFARRDSRVMCIALPENRGIGSATNAGVLAARGEYVCFLDQDDVLTPDALSLAAGSLTRDPTVDFLYADEDKIAPGGRLVQPWFRPDRNTDLLLAYNFVSHPIAVRRSAIIEVGMLHEDLGGAQDHDLALRLSDFGAKFAHLPEVTYHWRISSTSTSHSAATKPYTERAGLEAVRASVARMGWDASVRVGRVPNHFEVIFDPPEGVTVGVIVCSQRPAEAILDNLRYLVAPDSSSGRLDVAVVIVRQALGALGTSGEEAFPPRWSQVKGSVAFQAGWPNTAKALNVGARELLDRDVLVFVGDDVSFLGPDAVRQLIASAARGDIGAVGPIQLTPDGRIHRAGINNRVGSPEHAFRDWDARLVAEHDLFRCAREVSAVSATCMATRSDVFTKVGGFAEDVDCFDIDYCLRVRELGGYRVVVDPTYPVRSLARNLSGESMDQRVETIKTHSGSAMVVWPTRHDPYHGHNDLTRIDLPSDQWLLRPSASWR